MEKKKVIDSLHFASALTIIKAGIDQTVLPQKLQQYLDTIRCLLLWNEYDNLYTFINDYFDRCSHSCSCAKRFAWLITTPRSKEFFNFIHGRVTLPYPSAPIEEIITRFDLSKFSLAFNLRSNYCFSQDIINHYYDWPSARYF